MPVELIIGPSVRSMSRVAAEKALLRNPSFPAGADYTLSEHAGHYIAAFSVKADVPFAGGGPADADEESPAPKSEGPDDAEPSEDEGAPKSDSESKPPSEKGEEPGKGSEHKEQSELAHLQLLVQAIADALGVSLDAGLGSPVPGADDLGGPAGPGGPPVPPHPAPPAGPPGGPPAGPGGPGGDPHQHVLHEKSGPPMPPTFASADHPWAHTVGQVPHFRVAEEIGPDQSVADVEAELQALASAGGFQVRRARVETEDGKRRFTAIIKTPSA